MIEKNTQDFYEIITNGKITYGGLEGLKNGDIVVLGVKGKPGNPFCEVKITDVKNITQANDGSANTGNFFDPDIEVKKSLEKLKNSPFADEQHKLNLINFCGAIVTIASDLAESIECELKNDMSKVDILHSKLWQICSISDVLKEKINTDDFTHLQDLIYFYNKLQ